MDWCVETSGRANHRPVAKVIGDLRRTVRAGEHVVLDASTSTDPDGDRLSYEWFHYREPGTFDGRLNLSNADSARTSLTAPTVSRPCTAHIILTVRDNGTPGLCSYRRIILSLLN